jgi:hypothetical protein
MICSERKVLLDGCSWLFGSKIKVCWLVADKSNEQSDESLHARIQRWGWGSSPPPPTPPTAAPCSFGLSATSQQYFSLWTNQPSATSQQYFSLRTNQHQPSATSQPNRLDSMEPPSPPVNLRKKRNGRLERGTRGELPANPSPILESFHLFAPFVYVSKLPFCLCLWICFRKVKLLRIIYTCIYVHCNCTSCDSWWIVSDRRTCSYMLLSCVVPNTFVYVSRAAQAPRSTSPVRPHHRTFESNT